MSRAFYLSQIPGWTQAVNRARDDEFRSREDGWVSVTHQIGGIRVRTMTVRDYLGLLRLHCPLLVRVEPTAEELAVFLWLLSPEINRWHDAVGWRKAWLVGCRWPLFSVERWQAWLGGRKIRRKLGVAKIEREAAAWAKTNRGQPYIIPTDSPLHQAMVGAFRYVDEMFLDRPPGLAKEGVGAGVHYLASWFDAIQHEHGLGTEEIWRMPIPQLFGRLKAIAARNSPHDTSFNARQDALVSKLQAALQSDSTTVDEVLSGRFNLRDL